MRCNFGIAQKNEKNFFESRVMGYQTSGALN